MSILANKPKVSIKNLIFTGGNSFQLNENEKVILVGPNNSGKSLSLREILAICSQGTTNTTMAIRDLALEKIGTMDSLKDFLDVEADFVHPQYRYKNWSLHVNHIQFWDRDYITGTLASGFIKNITANDRLSICEQQPSTGPSDQKTMPQHVLYDDSALMTTISELFRDAFGKGLMFDFRGGNKLPIHVGDINQSEGSIDRVGDEYVTQVRQNPLLNEQGDGMRSYAGILFEAIVNDLDITLIDEPEAFLHPPQMRKLGETLTSNVEGQLFIATHSSDILRGCLEGTQGGVRILRISREGDSNIVREASGQTIKNLWEKPELRYSNALDGIFHEQTVICEDDSDCRLINSIADHLDTHSPTKFLDTAYVPTGGKHGVPKIAQILRKMGVPVKAILDFDFLSESDLVKKTVISFGGDWDEIYPLWNRVDAAVRQGNRAKTIPEIKENIRKIIDESDEGSLPRGDINEALKQGKEWNIVKKHGEQGIPNGQARTEYSSLQEKLESIGIYLVPVGEIENFYPKIGGHGPKFVTNLLSTISLDDTELSTLREFVKKVHNGSHSILQPNEIVEDLPI